MGLTKVGLPYASDPAVTKHLAAFLTKQAGAVDEGADLLKPTSLLFNGGVMRSELLRERLRTTINSWLSAAGATATRTLLGGDLDLAVARGAACYGRTRAGHGIRIRGGTARAYYVGIESAVPAVPGMDPPITLMCVAPFGMEEGTRAELPAHQLAVVVGEPVRFRFFGSSVRRHDAAGTTFERWAKHEIVELPPIEITLPADERAEGDVVPVELSAKVTEVGTLLIEAVPLQPKAEDERWKVELSVRES
jgi:hypothetical protein